MTESDTVADPGPGSSSDANSRPSIGGHDTLRGIFRSLCYFAAYLMFVQIYGTIFHPGRLVSALAQFLPYCLVLAAVVYRGRTLARFDEQALLMASCLASVFVVLAFDVTKNLRCFDGIPIVGRDSHVRNDIASLAIMVAIASFPAASYLMVKDLLLAKRQLDEQVNKLEEALRHVRRLQGLLPICMYCHRIRNHQQLWQKIELYISEHSDAKFTHGLCPKCAEQYYPQLRPSPGSNPASPLHAPPEDRS